MGEFNETKGFTMAPVGIQREINSGRWREGSEEVSEEGTYLRKLHHDNLWKCALGAVEREAFHGLWFLFDIFACLLSICVLCDHTSWRSVALRPLGTCARRLCRRGFIGHHHARTQRITFLRLLLLLFLLRLMLLRSLR